MIKSERRRKIRFLAGFLALLLMLGTVLNHEGLAVSAAGEVVYTVKVVDESGNPVEGAALQMSYGQDATEVTVTPGTETGTFTCEIPEEVTEVSYKVSGTYYEETTGTLDSSALTTPLEIEVPATSGFVKATFKVRGEEAADLTEAATIEVKSSDNVTIEEDTDGTYHLSPGESYTYSAFCENYKEITEQSFLANDTAGSQEISVSMTGAENPVTFKVTDPNNSPIQGAIIIIAGQESSLTTDESGEASFTAKKTTESYSYSVSRKGYVTAEGQSFAGDTAEEQTVTLNWADMSSYLEVEPLGTTEQNGDNATGAKLTFSGNDLEDGKSVQFYYGDTAESCTTKIGDPVTVTGGEAAIEFTGEEAAKLQTGLYFKAVYTGNNDHKYEATSGKIQYYKTQELKLSDEFLQNAEDGTYTWNENKRVLTVDYDTFKDSGFAVELDPDCILADVPESYQVVDETPGDSSDDIVSFSENNGEENLLKIKKLGETEIKIVRDQDEFEGYREAKLAFTLVVVKKVPVSDLNWETHEAVDYAGEKGQSFEITGSYQDEAISDEALSVTVKAVVVKDGVVGVAKAGTYNEMLIVDNDTATPEIDVVSTNEDDNYFRFDTDSLKEAGLTIKKDGILTINKITLDVQVTGEYSYQKDVKSEIEKTIKGLSNEETDRVTLCDGEEDSIVNKGMNNDTETVENALKEMKLKLAGVAALATEFQVTTYEKAVAPDLDAINATLDNYEFQCAETEYGNLVISTFDISELSISDLVIFDGTNIYEDPESDDTIWLKADKSSTDNITEGNLLIKPNGNSTRINEYEKVILNGEQADKLEVSADSGLVYSLESGIAKNTYKFYLQDGEHVNTKTTEKEIKIYVDADAPVVTFNEKPEEQVSVLDELLETITFGLYKNEDYEWKYSITDGEGSGIQESSYYVLELEEEHMTEGSVDAVKIRKVVEKLGDSWTSCNSTGSVPVPDAEAAAYVVLIKTSDHVNNEKIYVSNGIIVEHVSPKAEIIGLESTAIYDEDDEVRYSVTASDGVYQDADTMQALGVSGVDYMITEVLVDGVSQEEEEKTFYANPATGEFQNEPYTGTTYAPDVTEYTQDFVLDSKYNSNDIEIKVTVYDRAGNSETVSQKIKVDRTAPEIFVSYDNNQAQNGVYFGAERTTSITYTERNFDPAKAAFDITLEDGTAYEGITLEEINDLDIGIEAAWGEDSQKNFEESAYTDNRTVTATVKFVGDNAYSFILHCVDKAGNENETVIYDESTAEGTTQSFVVDKTQPEISVKYYVDGQEILPGQREADRIYRNKTIDAVVTILEHNFRLENDFAAGQINYEVTASKVGEGQNVSNYQEEADKTDAWGPGDGPDVYQSDPFIFEVDANYTASFTYTDLAGNSVAWRTDYYTVDKTPPTGEIEIVGHGVWEQFFDQITFQLFSKDTLTVNLSKGDVTSPTYDAQYYKSYEALSRQEVEQITSWTTADTFKVAANEQFVPYLKVTDYAGNVAYFSTDTYAVVDDREPLNEDTGKPIITITADEPAHGIYNQDVPFTISVEDPVVGNTYSGIAEVTYEVIKDDETRATQAGRYTYEAGVRQRTMTANEVVLAEDNNSNNVKIRVTAVDNAGNASEEIRELRIDITEPVIAISFDNNAAMNNTYYKDTRTATVTVTERNFDEAAFRFTISNTDGTQPVISGWSHSANAGISDEATHTCTVTFGADGDYNLSAVCTDLAGNQSEAVNVPEFTIDKTLPEITVSYDNNAASSGNYYNQSRTATIRIQEHNFNPGDVEARITAMLLGQGITAPSISGWRTQGDSHTATVTYQADGDYTFDIAYTDLAGNAAAAYPQDIFTVDTTAPEILIELPKDANGENRTAYGNEEIAPVILCEDTNQDPEAVVIQLVNMRNPNEEVNASYSVAREDTRQVVTFGDFEHVKDMDGLYVLTITMTDRAGNVTEETITFSVNRFGAYYILSDSTRNLVDAYYTNQEQEIVITEYNLSVIDEGDSVVYFTRDGETVNLSPDSDYTRTGVSNQGWYEYTYTMAAENFATEGYYDIAVESEDATGNKMTNKLNRYTEDDSRYNAEIQFIVDKTSPTVSIHNLDEGAYNETSHEAVVVTTDNIAVWSVDVYCAEESALNGQEIEEAVNPVYHFENGAGQDEDGNPTEGEITAAHGELPITIQEANGYQVVKAVARDVAGNEMYSEEYRVLVTSNLWVQFYNNTPLFVSTMVLLGAAIVVIVLLAVKHRKKEQ